ncbi:MAG TPA: hypothetical protein DIT32_00530 [Peptococcaceae bacterium]|nr:hypothetical protein [Peptococcaceae bacterium]
MLNWTFFIGFILLTAWVGHKASKEVVSAEDFMVAGGKLGPVAISCTMIATWLGTGSLIGFVGTGYNYGITVVSYTAAATLAALTIRYLWCEWLRNKGFVTMPDWMGYIYGSDKYIKAFTSFCYIFMYCSWTVGMASGCGIMCKNLLGIPTWVGALVCGIVFIAFTVTGGMYAVAWMDVFQQVVITIGILLLFVGIGAQTGWYTLITPENLGTQYFNFSLPNYWWVISIVLTYFFGNLFGQTYYQRIYASRDLKTAKIGLLAGAIAVILVGIYCMYVGLSVRATGVVLEKADDAVFWAINQWMPFWMKPVYLIAILAAAFSTADSALNAASTNVANDIYKNIINPKVDDKSLIKVAKIATVVLGVLCVGLALRPITMLVLIFKGAQVAIIGGIFWPIILGMYWKGAAKSAARVTTLLGAVVGIVFEFSPGLKTLVGGGAIPGVIAGFILMFGISLFSQDKCGGAYYRKLNEMQTETGKNG